MVAIIQAILVYSLYIKICFNFFGVLIEFKFCNNRIDKCIYGNPWGGKVYVDGLQDFNLPNSTYQISKKKFIGFKKRIGKITKNRI